MQKIAVIMGSDSDLPIAEKAVAVLKEFEVPCTVRVMSAHRTPDEAAAFAKAARADGIGAIIAIAGKAAHLGGVIASYTTLPVITIPGSGGALKGVESLLSSVEMPPGIPVASVGIDAGQNAALLALSMISIEDGSIAGKLDGYRRNMREKILKKDSDISGRL